MTERAYHFGSHGGLVGVVCEPDRPVAQAPMVLFTNVGLNHRVGPNRTWVELARTLAEAGYLSLRFDSSGLGDSDPRPGVQSDAEQSVLDLREAMEFLGRRRGGGSFVLVGNCSGVDALHRVAVSDASVVGAIAIDGYTYRNEGYGHRRRLSFLEPRRWRRRLRQMRFFGEGRAVGDVTEVWKRDIPTQEAFSADLDVMVRRNVRLLFVFTSGADQRLNHAGQFHDTFGHRSEVEVAWFPRADHLFSGCEERRKLLLTIRSFLVRHWPRTDRASAS